MSDERRDEPDAALADDLDGAVPLTGGYEGDLIETARRRHGALGSMVAAGMLGIERVLGRKPKEEIPVVVASNSDPHDIDRHGIVIPVDEATSVVAPPLPRRDERAAPRRARGKRRRSAP